MAFVAGQRRPAQEDPAGRVHRRDPEVAVGQDPAQGPQEPGLTAAPPVRWPGRGTSPWTVSLLVAPLGEPAACQVGGGPRPPATGAAGPGGAGCRRRAARTTSRTATPVSSAPPTSTPQAIPVSAGSLRTDPQVGGDPGRPVGVHHPRPSSRRPPAPRSAAAARVRWSARSRTAGPRGARRVRRRHTLPVDHRAVLTQVVEDRAAARRAGRRSPGRWGRCRGRGPAAAGGPDHGRSRARRRPAPSPPPCRGRSGRCHRVPAGRTRPVGDEQEAVPGPLGLVGPQQHTAAAAGPAPGQEQQPRTRATTRRAPQRRRRWAASGRNRVSGHGDLRRPAVPRGRGWCRRTRPAWHRYPGPTSPLAPRSGPPKVGACAQ